MQAAWRVISHSQSGRKRRGCVTQMQRGRLTAVARCGALLSESAGVSLRLLISPQRRPIKSQLRLGRINGWPQRRDAPLGPARALHHLSIPVALSICAFVGAPFNFARALNSIICGPRARHAKTGFSNELLKRLLDGNRVHSDLYTDSESSVWNNKLITTSWLQDVPNNKICLLSI